MIIDGVLFQFKRVAKRCREPKSAPVSPPNGVCFCKLVLSTTREDVKSWQAKDINIKQ